MTLCLMFFYTRLRITDNARVEELFFKRIGVLNKSEWISVFIFAKFFLKMYIASKKSFSNS